MRPPWRRPPASCNTCCSATLRSRESASCRRWAPCRRDPGASIVELGRSLRHFGVIFITLSLFAAFGYRLTRARAMASQYGFEMERAGLLSWREKN